MYVYVCLCVFVCERARERAKESKRGRSEENFRSQFSPSRSSGFMQLWLEPFHEPKLRIFSQQLQEKLKDISPGII